MLSTTPPSMDPLAQAVLIWDQERLAPACEHSAAVKAGVEAYLGRAVFGADPSLVIRVRISRAPSGDAAVATVSQEDESGRQWGERSVTAANCEDLDEPLTLVVALMVDASSTSTSAPNPASQPPVTEPEPPPAPPELPVTTLSSSSEPIETAPSLQRQTAQPGHWAVFASALASMGLLPDAGFGVGLDARLKPARFWGVSLDAGSLSASNWATAASSSSSRALAWGCVRSRAAMKPCGGAAVAPSALAACARAAAVSRARTPRRSCSRCPVSA